MTRRAEEPSAKVPLAQQAEETRRAEAALRSRWRWVEPCAWTVRMLAALEQGVEGGKWFRLFDKVFSERNLLAAFQRVLRNDGKPGVDYVTVSDFERQLPDSIWELSDRIKTGAFTPQAIRRVQIPKPGTTETRPLGIPTVRDRVVQGAIVNVIEPIFERDFAEQSYGFRPGRGCKEALRRVDQLLKAGYRFVVDADLKSYFDTIPHDRLLDLLREKIADGPVLSLIEQFLKAGILDGQREWTPTEGAPQGAVLSPLLSNVYLNPLDHLLAHAGYQMVRYADDFVILCRTAEEAQAALQAVQAWVADAGLTLHPTKTRVLDHRTEGFDFLGYHFASDHRRPRDKSLQKLKDTIRRKVPRKSGDSLQFIIAHVNKTLRGWFVYFQHSHRRTFARLDRFIRQRFRMLLKKRLRRPGYPKGADMQRWPNAFFAARGLFSLEAAHLAACRSLRR
jgi:RNA-directed DNA polymerase